MPCEDMKDGYRRDWNSNLSNQGMPGLLEAGKGRKNPPLEVSKRAGSCPHLNFGLLASIL